jgi:hypothetical protein
MANLLGGWEHDPDDLGAADRATYARATRPGRPVVLVTRSHTGRLGLGPPFAQAFATLGEAIARAEQVWERSGRIVEPQWISDGSGRYRPVRR